jgi:hypothetical protein
VASALQAQRRTGSLLHLSHLLYGRTIINSLFPQFGGTVGDDDVVNAGSGDDVSGAGSFGIGGASAGGVSVAGVLPETMETVW